MHFAGVFKSWLPLAVAVTGLCGLVYATVQQNYRQSLNDPQIQMAEDAEILLAHGAVPASVIPSGEKIDIAKSLAPFIAVYDKSGNVLESSGILAGAPPNPPRGVFEAARANNGKDALQAYENRVTWEPYPYVRQAIVVVAVPQTGQFVVAGRNMREVEERESRLSLMIALGWAVLIAATFVAKIIARWRVV